jgi:hypothetical protein
MRGRPPTLNPAEQQACFEQVLAYQQAGMSRTAAIARYCSDSGQTRAVVEGAVISRMGAIARAQGTPTLSIVGATPRGPTGGGGTVGTVGTLVEPVTLDGVKRRTLEAILAAVCECQKRIQDPTTDPVAVARLVEQLADVPSKLDMIDEDDEPAKPRRLLARRTDGGFTPKSEEGVEKNVVLEPPSPASHNTLSPKI